MRLPRPLKTGGRFSSFIAGLFLLSLLSACGGGGGVNGGGDEPAHIQNITTQLARASTQTFPSGSFPKTVAVAGNEVWVSNEYTKLVVAAADLDTLPDSDHDLYPDICESLKGFDAADAAVPALSPSDPVGTCGDIAFSRLTVLKPDTLGVLAQVDVPREANYIAATSDSVYVSHYSGGLLTKLDRATRKILTTKKIGNQGVVGEIILDEARDRLFTLDSTISVGQPRNASFFIEVPTISAVGKNGAFTVNKLEIPAAQGLGRRVSSVVFLADENKAFVAAYDQKRVYQINTATSPPTFATYDKSVRGNSLELTDTAGDPAVIAIDSRFVPMLSASTLVFKDKTIAFNPLFESTDSAGVKSLKAWAQFRIDTDGDATDDRTFNAVLDMTKGDLTFYDFVTVSGAKVTTDDKNKIQDTIRYKGEHLIAKDYAINVTAIAQFNKDGEAPSQLRLMNHQGTDYLMVLYPDVDEISLVKLVDNGLISSATRFGNLTVVGDNPQDVVAFDAFPSFDWARLYVSGRNDGSLTLLNVDFTQASGSALAINFVQKEFWGTRPWDLVPAGGTGRKFYMALHGEHAVSLLEGAR